MKKFVAVVICAICADALFAVDAVWANSATTVQEWHTAGNWQDADTGEALGAAPTAAADTASFPHLDTTMRTVNLFPASVNLSWALGSLSGGKYWRMQLSAGNQTYGHYNRTVEIGDINSFTGSWSSVSARQTLRLTAASGEQRFKKVAPGYQFPVDVASAAVTAVVERLEGTSGTLYKSGAGGLRVKTVYNAPLSLQIASGEVQIDGIIGGDDPVFSKAAVHFDASRPETLLTYEDDKGRTRVTNWLNCAAGALYDAKVFDNTSDTTKSHVKNIGVPVLTQGASGTGLPMVDFGYSRGGTSTDDSLLPATDEPTNCVMRFTRLTNVREVFAVFDHKGMGGNSSSPVIGDKEDYAFACNEYDCFKNASTYPALSNGDVSYNNSDECKKMGGDGRIDWPFDSYSPVWNDLVMVNVKAAADLCLNYLASDRLYKGSSGGVRIGEVLLFTNELTAAERKNVSEYLMRKWFGAYPRQEFKLVHVADGAEISVPAGHTARLGTVCAQGTLVKKGGGTLEINRLYPADATVLVEDGRVDIVPSVPAVSTSAPAGTPQFWYDADAENAFNIVDGVVTNWYDCRSDYRTSRQTSAIVEAGKVTEMPTVDTSSLPGHTVLDFPWKSAMNMPGRIGSSYAFQREILMVFSFTSADAVKNYNHIGAGGYTTDRNAYKFADPNSADDAIGGEVFTINGVPVDPVASAGSTFERGKWYVVAASFSGAINCGRIASNSSRNRAGCIKIGEIITYSSALSDDERRNTVAYLMKKWLGKDHPDVAVEMTPALEFAADRSAEIGSDADVDYRAVSGGDGSLVKRGAGSTSVMVDLDDGFESLAVESGTLTVGKAGYCDKSAFHFDAMAAQSLTTYVSDNGSGGLQTNVSSWADVRANGIWAQKRGFNSYMNFTNPVLTHVEMRPGVWRPALDFLSRFGRSASNQEGTYLPGAGMDISTEYKNIVEAHVVFSDKPSVTMPVFTAKNEIQFNRGGNGHLFASSVDATETKAATQVQEGYIALDNAPATPSTSLPTGFHLVSIVPTSAVSINTIGAERAINGGGSLQAELIGFTTAQSQAERQYLQAYLMHKWFGEAKPVWTNQTPMASISVAAGAALNISGDLALQVSSLSGSGTINAASLVNVSEIVLECRDGVPVAKAIEGDIGFADEVTLTLDGDLRRLQGGEYTLLEVSGGIDNFRPEAWTIVSNIKASSGVSVKLSGNTVVLDVPTSGMILIVQ